MVTCWRCGNERAAGPAWCPTCQAPEVAPVGVHDTYRGPVSVAPSGTVRRQATVRAALVTGFFLLVFAVAVLSQVR